MEFSPFLIVRQSFPSHRIPDLEAEVREQLSGSGFAARLKPGSSVAIGVGSRGIADIDTIVRAAVAWWKDQGMKPFIFPAMGSHGAATAKGQAEVLAKYGITESTMGCPVRSSLAVVELGATEDGIPTFTDKTAFRSGGVMLCGRVKWHTDFEGKLESGLFKMMAIGLGKLAGAQNYHARAHRTGLEQVIRSVGRQVLKSNKILGGLAILEDGNHQVGKVEAVRVEEMETREEQLLALVKTWMPRIPVRELDFLIVNEIGKNFSGAGMDTKVINRTILGAVNPWPGAPLIDRIFARDLSARSYGNAVGIGMCDVINSRILKKMKKKPSYMNAITACTPAGVKIPVNFPKDKQCLEQTWRMAGKQNPADVTFGWIRNSQDLSKMAFSANLRAELEANPMVEILGPAKALEFDRDGQLLDWLA